AWTIGYAARVAPAGLEMLTLSGFAGPFGVLAASGEPAAEGSQRPIFQAIKGLCDLAGLSQVSAKTSDEARLAALAGRSASGETIVCLTNLTADDVAVDASALGQGHLVLSPYAIIRIG
ncbi:MAG: hypothetical protein E5W21_22685, partial [Mesorhizobium sp.]